jgi:hypothetical protein
MLQKKIMVLAVIVIVLAALVVFWKPLNNLSLNFLWNSILTKGKKAEILSSMKQNCTNYCDRNLDLYCSAEFWSDLDDDNTIAEGETHIKCWQEPLNEKCEWMTC